jgi:hypothetical protein
MSAKNSNDPQQEKNITVSWGNDKLPPTGNPYGHGNGRASGGGSSWNFGFGGNGGGGGSSGFGGRSNSRRRRLHLAAQAQRQAQARAQVQREQEIAAQNQAIAARQQMIATQTQQFHTTKTAIDDYYGLRSKNLEQQHRAEVRAARKAHDPKFSGSSWPLYIVKKEKAEIDGLLAQKMLELQLNNAQASSFYGSDPLTRSIEDYLNKLNELQAHNSATANDIQTSWERSYRAAKTALELADSVQFLTEQSNALAAKVTVREALARAAEEHRRQHQLAVDENLKRLRFKLKADEILRHGQITSANTLDIPAASSLGAAVLTRTGVIAVNGAAIAIDSALRDAVAEIGRIAAIRVGPAVGLFVTVALYSPKLANSELTSGQRNRLFQGIAVAPQTLGLPADVDLERIADTRGKVDLPVRLRIEATEEGVNVNAAQTGGIISSGVPVIRAIPDPITGRYTAKLKGPLGKTLNITPQNSVAPSAERDWAIDHPEFALQADPQAETIPLDADTRINDCIVCIPGLPPRYLSFAPHPIESGVVTGNGQPTSYNWWADVEKTGTKIPSQIADRSRGKEFADAEAFESYFWRELAAEQSINSTLSKANLNRINNGFIPVAPKSQWVGGRHEFELYDKKTPAQREGTFNLNDYAVGTPIAQGTQPTSPPTAPWSVPGSPEMRGLLGTLNQQHDAAQRWFEDAIEAESQAGSRTETPIVPPGSGALGSTTLPISPTLPTVYTGDTTDPIQIPNETLPGIDSADVNAIIPGVPADSELPSPGVMFNDRRDDPGFASGFGQPVLGTWLGEATRGAGAPIPSHIADQLRGQAFSNFHRFREALWKTVAADPELSKQFSTSNLKHMRKGRSPFPLPADQVGGRVKLELHHKQTVAAGGAVYDMENLVIMTPKQHIETHRGAE